MFEQNADGFIPPEDYPEKSVAVAGSHDMATLAGWFAGTDIELKEKLGRYPEAEGVFKQRDQRRREKQALEALLRGAKPYRLTKYEFIDAVHRFLGQTGSVLAIAQLDDLMVEADPVNVPGTIDHPNWQRKYRVTLEALHGHSAWQQVTNLRCSVR